MHDKFAWGISSKNTRLIIKNSLNKAIFCSVFFLVFSFSCPWGNSSSETLSANLEVPDRRPRNYDRRSAWQLQFNQLQINNDMIVAVAIAI